MGALVNGVQRHAVAEGIRQQVKQAAVVGADETSGRVNGNNCWQWVFQTPQWVYMRIHRRRTAAVIREVLPEARPEVWVSDLGSMQVDHPAQHLQVRDLQYAIDAYRGRWAYRLQSLVYRAIRLGKQLVAHFTAQVPLIHQELQHILSQYPNNPDSQRLHSRYTNHQAS